MRRDGPLVDVPVLADAVVEEVRLAERLAPVRGVLVESSSIQEPSSPSSHALR
jgi:hypothetical protein